MQDRSRDYDSEIYYTDHYLGKLLESPDALKLRNSTMVVLTADHGESLGQHNYAGHGRQIYEDTVHIPLIVRYPGTVKAGQAISTPVSITDIASTLVDLTVKQAAARKKPRIRLTFSGRSLAAALTEGQALTQRWVYYVTFPGKKGFAPSWLSRLWVHDEEMPLLCGRLDGYSKMIWDPKEETLQLFDLRSDPLELTGRALTGDDSRYTTESAQLERWFSRTQTRAAEQPLSAHDLEILKSLGYVQ
jgi:arylsulfatase A-like enzyme